MINDGGYTETVVPSRSVKKVFLETLQISQKNNCARDSFLINLQACLRTFLRTPSLTEQLLWLLLDIQIWSMMMDIYALISYSSKSQEFFSLSSYNFHFKSKNGYSFSPHLENLYKIPTGQVCLIQRQEILISFSKLC